MVIDDASAPGSGRNNVSSPMPDGRCCHRPSASTTTLSKSQHHSEPRDGGRLWLLPAGWFPSLRSAPLQSVEHGSSSRCVDVQTRTRSAPPP